MHVKEKSADLLEKLPSGSCMLRFGSKEKGGCKVPEILTEYNKIKMNL